MLQFNKEICKKVKSSFAEALEEDVDNLDANKDFDEYSDLDSMGFVKLIISLNKLFVIELDTEKILECKNIIEVSNYIETLV
ncbi:MAG: hypothetical protein CBE11_03710 [Rickettsiales bacterium TMED251]|nr:MAG: hypothetical protein CBE11_03710 [Rickettsiales bacterium TMED251]|tara:strand:- start:119 stop:364 length:246 start_codon:yes stop_codon:yes gene_type:complete